MMNNTSSVNKDIVKSLLSYYGLADADFEMINTGLSSLVFLISYKNKKYILKIYDKKSKPNIEVKFGDFLKNNGLPVASIIKNNKNRKISIVGDFFGVLFEFCSGTEIIGDNLSNTFSENLAEIVTKMHFLSLNKYSSLALIQEGHGCNVISAKGITNEKIIQLSKNINKELKILSRSKLRESFVHGDLTRQNILVDKDNETIDAIIDFGDAHQDYIVWDLAVLITHIFITKRYGIDWNALSVFIKKYYSLFSLSEQEKEAIIPLMKLRNINLAIEVNRLSLKKDKNIDELLSIENSVIIKINIINQNYDRLSDILK